VLHDVETMLIRYNWLIAEQMLKEWLELIVLRRCMELACRISRCLAASRFCCATPKGKALNLAMDGGQATFSVCCNWRIEKGEGW
jgi:hypothetical protein